jgi:hypothetical protein
MKKNKIKKIDDIQKIDDNETIIRYISNFCNNKLGLNKKRIGNLYKIIHLLFIFFIVFITLFNNNKIHLCILLIIISFDAFSVVILHECPITRLEDKYLNTSLCKERREKIEKMNILYKCDHEYEQQIELLINVWMIIAFKCLIIIFLKSFNFKLTNYNDIYV